MVRNLIGDIEAKGERVSVGDEMGLSQLSVVFEDEIESEFDSRLEVDRRHRVHSVEKEVEEVFNTLDPIFKECTNVIEKDPKRLSDFRQELAELLAKYDGLTRADDYETKENNNGLIFMAGKSKTK